MNIIKSKSSSSTIDFSYSTTLLSLTINFIKFYSKERDVEILVEIKN